MFAQHCGKSSLEQITPQDVYNFRDAFGESDYHKRNLVRVTGLVQAT
jgi:hypothetical protein